MPLLRRKRFSLEPAPTNLRANEEVFYVQATGEIFRDYATFFNRTILCNSYVWDCEYTGKTGCTYAVALKSEKEAKQQMDSLPTALQRTIVTLIHNVIRAGISGLTEELTGYLRERYQVGEAVEYTQKKLQVTIIEVFPPPVPEGLPTPTSSATPSSMSSPANGLTPLASRDPSPSVETHVSVIVNATTPVTNTLSSNNSQLDDGNKTPTTTTATNSSGKKKSSSRHHKVHAIPIAEDANCKPAAYQYRIRMSDGSLHTVNANTLNRRKGVLTQDKVKFFLKAALYKTNPDNRAPLHVKDEFLKKFSVGESKVFPSQPLQLNDDTDFKTPPTSSAISSKKRHLSQSSLDNYFASSFSSSSGSAHKKTSKPQGKPEKPSVKKEHKKSPGKGQKSAAKLPSKSSVKKPSPPKSLILVTSNISNSGSSNVPVRSTNVVAQSPRPQTPRTPVKTPVKTPIRTPTKSPSLSRTVSTSVIMSAKKTRTLKQIREQLKRKFLTTEQRIKLEGEMKRKLDEKKEERKKQLQELREKKLAEKKRLIELMKPREDQLCEDSKTLPEASLLKLQVPEEHFADVAMILEFLNTFGPLFDLEEVIQRKITYDLIEEALLSTDIQGPLYDIVKFLLQAVFAAMDEDNELKVSMREGTRSNCHSPVPPDSTDNGDTVNNVDKDVNKEEQDEKQDGGSSLRVKLSDAHLNALWPLQHQGVTLNELVLNSYTLSEVLRLHFLSAGGYQDDSERRTLRYQRRGGYSDKDNPSVMFRTENASLLDSLKHKSLFDMNVSDRVLILRALCMELLTFTMTRDAIEESKYKWKKANRNYQQLVKEEEHQEKKKKVTIKKSNKEERKDNHSTKEKQQGDITGNTEIVQQLKEKPVNDITTLPVSQQNGYCSGEEEGNVKSTTHSPVKEPNEENEDENEEERVRKKEELKSEMLLQSSMSNLKPLGVDRLHRKYWLFNSLCGLYVEHDSTQLPPPPIPSVTPSPNGSSLTRVDQATSVNVEQSITELINSGLVSQQPPQELTQHLAAVSGGNNECETTREECFWRCYTSEDDFMALLDALNPRGIREKSLKDSLCMHKDHILSTIHKCPFAKTRAAKTSYQGYDGNLTAGEYLELCLREQILDLEEKIWLGGLGCAKDQRDRDEWRSQIESSGAAKKIEEYHKLNNKRQKVDGDTPEQDDTRVPKTILEVVEEQDTAAVAQELAQVLLQIERGIERKYLTAPLGTAVYENKKQKHKKIVIKACLDKWRSSLAVASNFSQVFLHLFTLERCIAWSRSLLNIRCRVCRRKGGDESMLLCDACDNGYHMYCLRPPLKKVPAGDWFCNDCKPATPVKPRRSTITQKAVLEALSEESSSDETSDYEEDSEQLDTASTEEEEDEEDDENVRRSARIQKQNAPAMAAAQSRRRPGRPKKLNPPVSKKQQKTAVTKSKKSVPEQPSGRKRKSSESERPSNNKRGRTVQLIGNKLAKITDEIASQYFDQGSTALRGKKKQAHRNLEQKLCRAILTELLGHPDSWPFLETSHQSDLHFYEFDNTDLSTLEERVESSQYRLEDFVWDVRTIFLNCPQLHRRNSEASRAGSSLEKYFEGRLMELGIRMDKEQQERKHRQFLYRMLNK